MLRYRCNIIVVVPTYDYAVSLEGRECFQQASVCGTIDVNQIARTEALDW